MQQINPTKLPLAYDTEGNPYTKKDILSLNIVRWSKGKKYLIVSAVTNKVLTQEEILESFRIDVEELESWKRGFEKQGLSGLCMRTLVDAQTRSGN